MLENGLVNLLEAEVHALLALLERSNVLLKLLVDLSDDSVEPIFDVCVRQINLFRHLNGLVVELLRGLNLNVQLMDFRVGAPTTLNLNVRLLVLHLQLVELLGHLLVLVPQDVQLLLVVAHGLEQLRVGCLPREELLYDLLNIGETRLRSNLLEGLLNLCCSRHLFVHL